MYHYYIQTCSEIYFLPCNSWAGSKYVEHYRLHSKVWNSHEFNNTRGVSNVQSLVGEWYMSLIKLRVVPKQELFIFLVCGPLGLITRPRPPSLALFFIISCVGFKTELQPFIIPLWFTRFLVPCIVKIIAMNVSVLSPASNSWHFLHSLSRTKDYSTYPQSALVYAYIHFHMKHDTSSHTYPWCIAYNIRRDENSVTHRGNTHTVTVIKLL